MEDRPFLNSQDIAGRLRAHAERTLNRIGKGKDVFSEQDVQLLFQELQVHQIELEMQNDELKVANEELELQQLKFSRIYNLAPFGYFILSQSGIIEEVNLAGYNLLEVGKLSLLGKRLIHYLAPEDRDKFYNFYHKMVDEPARQTCKLQMISASGREFSAQVEGIAVQGHVPGQVQYYITIVDETERLLAQQNLDEARERLEQSLEASSAGTWELELDSMKFHLEKFNHHICANPDGGFDGRYNTFINYIHPEDRESVDEHFRTSINQEKGIDIACRLVDGNDKTCYVSLRGHVVAQPGKHKRLVGIIMDITGKKAIEEESLRLKQDQQKNIASATLVAEENERRRISDSLHDSVSQLLYGIKIKMGLLNTSAKSVTDIADIHDLLDTAIRQTRNISFELAPSILTDFGLPATIEELAKRLSTPKMQIQARFINFNARLPLPLELSIFRIIQELVNNCMKHSGADLINLEIKKNKSVEIKVNDNGRGFNVNEQEKGAGGAGLRSIKSRVSLYNGTMHINSSPGKGTTVTISIGHQPL